MKRIYLVRHGQSTSNVGGPAQPNVNIELTDVGHKQATEVAHWFMDTLGGEIDSVQVSKFLRTQQTARPLLQATGMAPVVMDTLHEFDYLSFLKADGQSLQARTDMANQFWLDNAPSEPHHIDSESYVAFCDRVAQGLAYFNNLASGDHVVFTHGLWISMLIWQILGQPANSNLHMRKFRQFEMAIRAKNGEVFCLTLADDAPPAITKVRECPHGIERMEYR